jgi:hypothetical protein
MATSPNGNPFLASCLFELGLGCLAIAIGTISIDPRRHVPAITDWLAIGWGCGHGFLGVVPLLVGLLLVERLPWRSLVELRNLVESKLVPLIAGWSWAEKGTLALCAGVGEELLFRGWLQAWLSPESPGIQSLQTWGAIVLAGVAFGACHAINRTYFLLGTLAGVYLGILYAWTGNLLVPIVAHGVYDIVAMAWVSRVDRSTNSAQGPEQRT